LPKSVNRFAYVLSAVTFEFFKNDCAINIGCRPHVLQTDLFFKTLAFGYLTSIYVYVLTLLYHALDIYK